MAARRPTLTYRPMTRDDGLALDTVTAGLSPDSRRMRYLQPLDQLRPAARAALLDIDDDRQVALLAEHGRRGRRQPVGIARYVVTAPGTAELAYEVVDAWQGHGIGGELLRRLLDVARDRGIRAVEAEVLPENAASLRILRRALPHLRVARHADALTIRAELVDEPLTVESLFADLGTVTAVA